MPDMDIDPAPDLGRPRFSVRLEVDWSDGPAIGVTWADIVPAPDELGAAMAEAVATIRQVLAEADPATPTLTVITRCERPSCGHPRAHHGRSGSGPCATCEESVQCPAFLAAGVPAASSGADAP